MLLEAIESIEECAKIRKGRARRKKGDDGLCVNEVFLNRKDGGV